MSGGTGERRMSKLIIEGGRRLKGEISVHGAKNSILPILAATLINRGQTVIHNCPDLRDVEISLKILRHLGCKAERSGSVVTVDSSDIVRCDIPDGLMREMRSSIIFLGAIIARTGEAQISAPGGCDLGPRPIDLHIKAFKRLGVTVKEEHGYLKCKADKRLTGSDIVLAFPSVGATENIMLAAAGAQGTTVIKGAAHEPEIVDLAKCLSAMGAKIIGAGESTVVIEGVDAFHDAEHSVIPDRIAAGTLLCAAAITGSEITLHNICMEHLTPVLPVFEEMGCIIRDYGDSCTCIGPAKCRAVKLIKTMPYPGFPTDIQSPVMAVTTLAIGTSIFVESIFESRFRQVGELLRLGAKISVEGKIAVVEGASQLSGAQVEVCDLRGGAAMVVAGLAAQGITEISGIRLIDRGYEPIEKTLRKLGASIRRE